MTKKKIAEILALHAKWRDDEDGGKRANLSRADLYGADLSKANLSGANLSRANLSRADLSRANLSWADLYGADLSRANLSGANLSRADLSGANLYGANLSWADLSGADLSGADLSRADLSGANLSRANLSGVNLSRADLSGANLSWADLYGAKNAELAWAITTVPADGDIIGWKKARSPDGATCIVRLKIPESAKRSSATGRKCRAEYAQVLEVIGAEYGISGRDDNFFYRPGEMVRPDSWDDNRWDECSHGIHFFITRAEAEAWEL